MRGGNDADKVYLYLADYSHVINNTTSDATPALLIGGISYGPSGYFLQDGGSQTDKGFTWFNGEILDAGETVGTPIYRRNIEQILGYDPLPGYLPPPPLVP